MAKTSDSQPLPEEAAGGGCRGSSLGQAQAHLQAEALGEVGRQPTTASFVQLTPDLAASPEPTQLRAWGGKRKQLEKAHRRSEQPSLPHCPSQHFCSASWITPLTICHRCFHGLDPGHDFCQIRKRGGGTGHILKHSGKFWVC